MPKYVPEPPEDIPPALAYALATEGAYDDRVVLATLLSLVDRGYYATRTSQEADLDLLIKAADNRPPTDGLEEYETDDALLLRRPARRRGDRALEDEGPDP